MMHIVRIMDDVSRSIVVHHGASYGTRTHRGVLMQFMYVALDGLLVVDWV